MTLCYACTDKATHGIRLIQGWEPTCPEHTREAEFEEPGILVCEIEDLEKMKRIQVDVA